MIGIFGDVHLGFKQYNIASREEDFFTALERVVEECKKQGINTLLCTGDLFNNSRPSGELVVRVRDLFEPFEVYGIEGNHDLSGDSWLKLCNITPLDREVIDYRGTKIAGLNWVRPAEFMDELDAFLTTIPGQQIDIFVIHQLLDEFVPFPQEAISAEEVAKRLKPFGVKRVVMGDLHIATDEVYDGITFMYTGSTEVNATNEEWNKSFIVMNPTNFDFTRVPHKTREFQRFTVQEERDFDSLNDSVNAFTLVEYDPSNHELERKLRAYMLGRGTPMFRLLPINVDTGRHLIEQMDTEGFDRADAMQYLADSVKTFFDPDTDEYQLVFQALKSTDNITGMLLKYAKSKGVSL